MTCAPATFDLLRLTLAPGFGPILIARALDALGSPADVLAASPARLASIRGIGEATAAKVADGLKRSLDLATKELELARTLGVSLVAIHDATYPEPLKAIPNPPPILYVRGRLNPPDQPLWGVAIVGSRRCSHYGIEQAERFAGILASAGLTIISGGARGIDTAAHRGTLRVRGRTIAVLGCGLAHCYPPENRELFDQMASGPEPLGAVVSELPLSSSPQAENFPARNRIISGMALGVLVIEAGDHSGALITARQAVEEQGREVMAIPGRIDSAHSAGSHALLKSGGASLVTDPGDVLEILRSPARHQAVGTFVNRYATSTPEPPALFAPPAVGPPREARPAGDDPLASPAQRRILESLAEPRTVDQLAAATELPLESLRAELTMLEIQRRIKRDGPRLVRTK